MTTPADIAAEFVPEPEPLAYATATTTGPTLTDLQPALSKLLGVAVLSGLCVGSCFLLMADHRWGGAVHLLLYAAILFLAVRSGVELAKIGLSRPGLFTLDAAAGLGLLMIGLVPIGLWLLPRDNDQVRLGAVPLALAFALLALTSVRHLSFYQKLSYPVRAAGYRKTAIWLRGLGWFKALFETLWLICCAVPLLVLGLALRPGRGDETVLVWMAMAGFLGCFVYAGIWITMIVLHARVLRLSRVQRPVGFEVLMPEPVIG